MESTEVCEMETGILQTVLLYLRWMPLWIQKELQGDLIWKHKGH